MVGETMIETVKETVLPEVKSASAGFTEYAATACDTVSGFMRGVGEYFDNAMRNWKPMNLFIAGATICGVLSIVFGNTTGFKAKVGEKEFSFSSKSKDSDSNDQAA